MTVKEIIYRYLDENAGHTISSHEIESSLPGYGFIKHGKLANPSTYSRKFRLLKHELTGLKLIPVSLKSSIEAHYRVERV